MTSWKPASPERIFNLHTVLDANGRDQDHFKMLSMLRHWLGEEIVGRAIGELDDAALYKIFGDHPKQTLHQIYHPDSDLQLDKQSCARILRGLCLNKRIRFVIAQCIHSQSNPPIPLLAAIGQLKQVASELKELVSAQKAGVAIPNYSHTVH
jgi:hypothetical protein